MLAFLQRFRDERIGLLLALPLVLTALPAKADYDQAVRAANEGQRYQAVAHPNDPWEKLNRKIFGFNETVDTYTAKPAAKAYRKVVPGFIRTPIGNFFDNLRDLRSGVNNMLQWRWRDAGQNLGRFGVNTTLGVGGLFDVASDVALERRSSDFGITLARWGAPQGPYMVLPLLGPSTVRDTVGMIPDDYLAFRRYMDHDLTSWTVLALYALDLRAEVLDYEAAISGDRYNFLRDFYLNSRAMAAGTYSADDDFEFGSDLEAQEWDEDDW